LQKGVDVGPRLRMLFFVAWPSSALRKKSHLFGFAQTPSSCLFYTFHALHPAVVSSASDRGTFFELSAYIGPCSSAQGGLAMATEAVYLSLTRKNVLPTNPGISKVGGLPATSPPLLSRPVEFPFPPV